MTATKRVTVTLTAFYMDKVQDLLDRGVYYKPSDLWRHALELLFKEHGMGEDIYNLREP